MAKGKDVEIELLKKDVANGQQHMKQVDSVLEQIKELAGGIAKMIAIHEEKHLQHQKEGDRLRSIIAQNDIERKRETEALEKRLDETKDQIHKRIEKTEKNLIAAIEGKDKDTSERLRVLEIWKWKFAGVTIACAAIFTIIINFQAILAFLT